MIPVINETESFQINGVSEMTPGFLSFLTIYMIMSECGRASVTLHNMIISIKNDIWNIKHMSCTFTAPPNVQGLIYLNIYFILQPVAFKGAVSENVLQCNSRSTWQRTI